MKKKKIFLFLLILCWIGIVFMFSSEASVESDKRSDPIVEILMDINKDLKINKNTNEKKLHNAFINIVRKSAHFILYLFGGILVYLFANCYSKTERTTFFITLMVCLVYAISDEIHQYFVPGRCASATDVLIDTIGSLTGVSILKCLQKLRKVY